MTHHTVTSRQDELLGCLFARPAHSTQVLGPVDEHDDEENDGRRLREHHHAAGDHVGVRQANVLRNQGCQNVKGQLPNRLTSKASQALPRPSVSVTRRETDSNGSTTRQTSFRSMP